MRAEVHGWRPGNRYGPQRTEYWRYQAARHHQTANGSNCQQGAYFSSPTRDHHCRTRKTKCLNIGLPRNVQIGGLPPADSLLTYNLIMLLGVSYPFFLDLWGSDFTATPGQDRPTYPPKTNVSFVHPGPVVKTPLDVAPRRSCRVGL